MAHFGPAQRRGYPRKRLVGDTLFSFCDNRTSAVRNDTSGRKLVQVQGKTKRSMKKIAPSGPPGNASSLHGETEPPDVLAAKLETFKSELTQHIVEHIRALNDQLLQEHAALKPLMSVEDVARTLNVSARTVENLIGQGKLRPLWIKGQRRFHPDAVDAYVRACEQKPRSRKRREVR